MFHINITKVWLSTVETSQVSNSGAFVPINGTGLDLDLDPDRTYQIFSGLDRNIIPLPEYLLEEKTD